MNPRNELEEKRFLNYFEKIIRSSSDELLDRISFLAWVEKMERSVGDDRADE